MGKQSNPVSALVLQAVRDGARTTREIVDAVAPRVPDELAMMYYRMRARNRKDCRNLGKVAGPLNCGRKYLVMGVISNCVQSGRLVRMGPSTYDLPPPGHTPRRRGGKAGKAAAGGDVPLRQRVLDLVLRGERSVTEVVAELGRYVSASQAVTASRREDAKPSRVSRNKCRRGDRPTGEHVEQGRRVVIQNELLELRRRGKIVRVRTGVYGPPPPRIFQPQAC